jgi:hypothetical protein
VVCRKFGRAAKTKKPIGREVARSNTDHGIDCEE